MKLISLLVALLISPVAVQADLPPAPASDGADLAAFRTRLLAATTRPKYCATATLPRAISFSSSMLGVTRSMSRGSTSDAASITIGF